MAKKIKNDKKVDKYLFEDNIIRFFLKDKLSRKSYLQKLTLEQLDNLVRTCNTLISNLNCAFEKGVIKIPVSDKNNWEDDSLFRDIILQNVLDFDSSFMEGKELKKQLKERWGEADGQ